MEEIERRNESLRERNAEDRMQKMEEEADYIRVRVFIESLVLPMTCSTRKLGC